jgi:single-strand DNA-binding protein
MNNIKNKVSLIGNLGNDPLYKEGANGRNYAQFNLATSSMYKNQDGDTVKDTQWHRIKVWGKLAKIAQSLLKKGHLVAVDGKLTHRTYDDKDGVTRYITEVVANEMMLLTQANAAN